MWTRCSGIPQKHRHMYVVIMYFLQMRWIIIVHTAECGIAQCVCVYVCVHISSELFYVCEYSEPFSRQKKYTEQLKRDRIVFPQIVCAAVVHTMSFSFTFTVTFSILFTFTYSCAFFQWCVGYLQSDEHTLSLTAPIWSIYCVFLSVARFTRLNENPPLAQEPYPHPSINFLSLPFDHGISLLCNNRIVQKRVFTQKTTKTKRIIINNNNYNHTKTQKRNKKKTFLTRKNINYKHLNVMMCIACYTPNIIILVLSNAIYIQIYIYICKSHITSDILNPETPTQPKLIFFDRTFLYACVCVVCVWIEAFSFIGSKNKRFLSFNRYIHCQTLRSVFFFFFFF